MTEVTLQDSADGSGDVILPLTDEMMESAGWIVGATLVWVDNGDGSFSITKQEEEKSETELVLVEAISTCRIQYLVEVPKGNKDWALDTVTLGEAKEFSQHYLGETILSHRVVQMPELMESAAEYWPSVTQEAIEKLIHKN
jgi:hypothetical protein